MRTTEQLEQHRKAIFGHCYRMLGSPSDAEDACQETMLRAWKAMNQFETRSALSTWLYRIATNVCLDALAERKRRLRPVDVSPPGTPDSELVFKPRETWIEPVPDALAIPADAEPGQQLLLRQSIRLAFVAALQHLPPKQRAALLSTEVLGLSAEETASALETSVASVNSAIQRARAKLAEKEIVLDEVQPPSTAQQALVERYVDAFESYDVEAICALMRDDARVSMPPITLWLEGIDAARAWMLGRGSECRGSRLLKTRANGLPAFGQYRARGDEGFQPWALVVLELRGERIASVTSFLDVDALFPLFDLPPFIER